MNEHVIGLDNNINSHEIATVLSPIPWVIPSDDSDYINNKYPNSLRISPHIRENPFEAPPSLIDIANYQELYHILFKSYLNKAMQDKKLLLDNINYVFKDYEFERVDVFIKCMSEVNSLIKNLHRLHYKKIHTILITSVGMHFFEHMHYILNKPDITLAIVNTAFE
ncbi:hypothetical protein AB7360_03430 [Providencia alcalifaciens]|uniref:hypothetical protein n=1 Tax=Providencia alcalifaciens TaxID=126385 RepID=UPI0032DB79CB